MHRRAAFVVGLVMSLVLTGGVGRGGAASTSVPADFVGTWTPDTTSSSALAGHSFGIEAATQSAATSAVEQDLDPTFEHYCTSDGAGNSVDFYVLAYTWSPGGEMGGCTSALTQGHIYAWGSHEDVTYVHPGSKDGESLLRGGWGVKQLSTHGVTYLPLTAHRPMVQSSARCVRRRSSRRALTWPG